MAFFFWWLAFIAAMAPRLSATILFALMAVACHIVHAREEIVDAIEELKPDEG